MGCKPCQPRFALAKSFSCMVYKSDYGFVTVAAAPIGFPAS